MISCADACADDFGLPSVCFCVVVLRWLHAMGLLWWFVRNFVGFVLVVGCLRFAVVLWVFGWRILVSGFVGLVMGFALLRVVAV